jgi:hypothetical protein
MLLRNNKGVKSKFDSCKNQKPFQPTKKKQSRTFSNGGLKGLTLDIVPRSQEKKCKSKYVMFSQAKESEEAVGPVRLQRVAKLF